jgi:radical SAM-linked protein
MRIFQRGLAASGLPVAYSRGFHPHMRMSFGPPLRTGWESNAEYLDVQFEEPVEGVGQRVNPFLPEGLRVKAAAEVEPDAPKLGKDIVAATLEVSIRSGEVPGWEDTAGRAKKTEEMKKKLAGRFARTPRCDEPADNQPGIIEVTLINGGDTLCIEYTSRMVQGRIVVPDDLVEAVLGDPRGLKVPAAVRRKAQFVLRDGKHLSPMNERVIRRRL